MNNKNMCDFDLPQETIDAIMELDEENGGQVYHNTDDMFEEIFNEKDDKE